jgi:hypothetical protein
MPDVGFKFTEVGSIAPSGAVDIRILRCAGDALTSSERLLNESEAKRTIVVLIGEAQPSRTLAVRIDSGTQSNCGVTIGVVE